MKKWGVGNITIKLDICIELSYYCKNEVKRNESFRENRSR